jgi:hypothetical protein
MRTPYDEVKLNPDLLNVINTAKKWRNAIYARRAMTRYMAKEAKRAGRRY